MHETYTNIAEYYANNEFEQVTYAYQLWMKFEVAGSS
jgi:hypothetical protein